MLAVFVHFVLFITYATVGTAIGLASYHWYDYSMVLSTCVGGLFSVACGLVHVALTPRSASLSRRERSVIDNEFQALKDGQFAIRNELETVRTQLGEEARDREAVLTREVRELAVLITAYVQSNERKKVQALHEPQRVVPRRSDQNLWQAVKSAIDENRVELHLQPIVTLPQRRTVYYECFTRLRDLSGGVILPGEFLRVAEPSGLVSEIDNLLLLRCVQIARTLIKRDRRMGLFCNISPTSLADETFFPQFIAFLRDNKDLAGSIIFEVPREAFDRLSIAGERNMGRLFDLGFRFSIDRCDTIDLDLRKLERVGVRYVKIAGGTLVRQLTQDGARPESGINRHFEAQEVSTLFSRYGVELIADRVEDERTIVEILELDISHAQGNLFGAPRPSKDIMEPTDRDAPVRLKVAS